MGRFTWWLGVLLGLLLVAAGMVETTRAVQSGDAGLWFWTPTLVGGGGLVLTGTLLGRRRPYAGAALTVVGAVLAVLPTAWTVVVPALLVLLVVLTLRDVGAAEERARRRA